MRNLILLSLTLLISPFLALLGVTLLIFNFVHLRRPTRPQPTDDESEQLSGIASIIILNWNGKDLLAQGLPSVLQAVRADGRPHEVLVVDNGSSDGSADYLRSEFPDVRVISLPENSGFARGNNTGVQSARNDVVVLLNNDMIVDPHFLRPLLDGFGPKTFAVSSQIFLQDPAARREETGMTTAAFRNGMIAYAHSPIEAAELNRPYYPVFWAGGGSSAFHRKRFLMLGGFQEVYSPAYVEDADLSYQAWKAGWEVLFSPDSIVYHKHRASSKRRFHPAELQILVQRNQFFFIWRNITSWKLLLSHCFFLPWHCYKLARDFGLGLWKSLFKATARIHSVQTAKWRIAQHMARADGEIFALFENPGRYFAATRRQRMASPGSDSRPRILWITAYLPHLGRHAGAGRMYQLLKRMAPRYRITLLSFLESEDERQFLPAVEHLCERVIAMRRVAPRRWNLFPYEPFDEFNTPEMRRALHGCLQEQDYSLMQLEYSQMGCYADRSLRIPALLTCHEVDFAACARRSRLESNPLRKLRWFYNCLQVLDRQSALTRRVDGAICMTDSDARELRRFCRRTPVHVINTGVDLDYFEPPRQLSCAAKLVFVGAFRHEPNVDAMLFFCRDILPRIRARRPETELVIVGSWPTPSIAALADLPGVEVTGFVPDIRPFMAASSVYIVPLRLGVGIRGKILEAWSMGMPVVATGVACAGLQFRDGENLLRADSPERFADCVLELLSDPVRRREMGSSGRRTVEQYYSWDAAADRLDSLYKKTMSDYALGKFVNSKVHTGAAGIGNSAA